MPLEEFIKINATEIALPLFFSLILLEAVAVRYLVTTGENDLRDSLTCLFMGISSTFINGAAAFISLGLLFWVAQFQIYQIPLSVGAIVLCFILDDFRYYWHHRFAHRCRWFWAMHVVHHSSQRYSLSVAFRQAWTKHFKGIIVLKVPLVLIGFDPILVIFCGFLIGFYQFWIHTEVIQKMPTWFEAIFNTPSHHRVHHGRNPKYLDANYGGTFIIWDRIFGTLVEEDTDDRPEYGLVTNINTYNPLRIAFHEYISIFNDFKTSNISLKSRLLYLLAPPGWSHDGSRMSSDELKAQALMMDAELLSKPAL